MAIKNIKVKVNVENNFVVDKTEEKKLCKILVAKGDKGQDGNVSFDELTEEQKAQLKGEDGKGIPEGGTAGQILAKTSDDDFDAEWIDNNAEIDLTDYAKKDEIPTKTSELENDSHFLVMNDDYSHITGRLHITNNFDDYQERKVDISAQYLMGAENGGLPSTLYINDRCDTDVRILRNGMGTLYYKEKEVATQEYVDEQIANIEITGGDIDLSEYATKEELTEYAKTTDLHTHDNKDILDSISQEDIDNWNNNTGGSDYELPIASAGTLGGIKVGMNLSIDADGTLNAVGSETGEGSVVNGEVLPIGTMIPFGSQNNIPVNWRICDGAEVSRTAYADLFNVIGTSYGAGDGETTFNLPNKKGRVSVGLDANQTEFKELGKKGGSKYLQAHNHINSGFEGRIANWNYGQGIDRWKLTTSASESGYTITSLDSAGLGDSENLQPYEVDVWIIKVSNVIGVLENENANVVDNLTSTSTTDVLSANMGRELNEKIKNIEVLEEYSTEEKVIGTWIDGKPIYRKVIQTTTPATANVWTDIDTGIENIETHISKNISYKVNTLTYFADAYENSTYRFLAVPNGNKVSVLVGISSWCSKPMTMVLEYTKTTD